MGLNQQLYDMGMIESNLFDVEMVNKQIENSKYEFDFVMVAELFEESLVLLADYLCWPLEFVVGVSHNVRKPNMKVSCIYIYIYTTSNTHVKSFSYHNLRPVHNKCTISKFRCI